MGTPARGCRSPRSPRGQRPGEERSPQGWWRQEGSTLAPVSQFRARLPQDKPNQNRFFAGFRKEKGSFPIFAVSHNGCFLGL